jgi:predicted amidohydrolase
MYQQWEVDKVPCISRDKIKVAALQVPGAVGSKDDNIENAIKWLSSETWDLAVLPELFSTEFFPVNKNPELFALSETVEGPTLTRMAEIAKKKRGYLVVPFFERDEADVCYNSAAVLDRTGKIIGIYRKTHIPFTRTYEKYYFSPGKQFPIFQTDFGPIGVLICYDRWYPEAWRSLILQGAILIAIPISSWRYGDFSEIPIWDPLIRIRARENLAWVAAANRTGKEGDYSFIGRSSIVNPKGEIIAQLHEKEEGLLVMECDLKMVMQERTNMPLLRDRRSEIY